MDGENGAVAGTPAGDPAAAAAGAGANGNGNGNGVPSGLYDKYVADAPPETRDMLASALHKFNSETIDPQLREAAEFRKRFEPLAAVDGIDQVAPEALSELVQFAQIAADPEQFLQWYQQAAGDLAEQDPEGFEEAWLAIGQQLGYVNEDGEGEGEADEEDPRITALEQQIGQMNELLSGFVGQQEQSTRQQAADRAVDEELAQLQQAHHDGQPFDEEFTNDLYAMAQAYAGDEQPLHKAYERLQRLSGQAQSQLVEGKLSQPAPANGAGRSDTTPPRVHSFEETQDPAVARLKAAHAG